MRQRSAAFSCRSLACVAVCRARWVWRRWRRRCSVLCAEAPWSACSPPSGRSAPWTRTPCWRCWMAGRLHPCPKASSQLHSALQGRLAEVAWANACWPLMAVRACRCRCPQLHACLFKLLGPSWHNPLHGWPLLRHVTQHASPAPQQHDLQARAVTSHRRLCLCALHGT